jgi:hypothetical protein
MFAARLAVLSCLLYAFLTGGLAALWTAACSCRGAYILIPQGSVRLTLWIVAALPLFAIWLVSFAIAWWLSVRRLRKGAVA